MNQPIKIPVIITINNQVKIIRDKEEIIKPNDQLITELKNIHFLNKVGKI